jgi:hypothetical protein
VGMVLAPPPTLPAIKTADQSRAKVVVPEKFLIHYSGLHSIFLPFYWHFAGKFFS